MNKLPDGSYPYNGFFDCFKKTIVNESALGLWAGLPTYYFRVAPHAMVALMVSEFLKKNLK